MRIDESAVIEAVIDELMMGDLAAERPSIQIKRLDRGSIRIDYGVPGEVFVVSVRHEA